MSTRKEDENELWLLHSSVDFVEKTQRSDYLQATREWINNSNPTAPGDTLTLYCKDLRILKIDIFDDKEYFSVAESIENLSKLGLEWQYPFFYRPMYSILEDGYAIFKPELEYNKLLATGHWRLSRINEDYKVCSTYPKVLIIPNQISDASIIESACFREGGRFPIFCYKHNEAILLRAAPIFNQNGMKRCPADETIVDIVLGRTTKGFILDTCKPGKGNVPVEYYTQWKKVLHTIKISPDNFSNLMEACNDTSCSIEKYLERLKNSNWLTLVLKTLNASCVVAQCLDKEKTPVLIQGSDPALLISALVQIILNPDCRTVRGFIALIDREFIQGGYPFITRHKYGCYSTQRTKESIPSFLLFLDCVYQLHYQFSCSFEFKM